MIKKKRKRILDFVSLLKSVDEETNIDNLIELKSTVDKQIRNAKSFDFVLEKNVDGLITIRGKYDAPVDFSIPNCNGREFGKFLSSLDVGDRIRIVRVKK